jgi:hypothetical protein
MLIPYLRACNVLRSLVEELDLEKYFEIYEISQSDLHDIALEEVGPKSEDLENLKSLKGSCIDYTLLGRSSCALSGLGRRRWEARLRKVGIAVDGMQRLASITVGCTEKLNNILGEEERKAAARCYARFGLKFECPRLCIATIVQNTAHTRSRAHEGSAPEVELLVSRHSRPSG